jgi:nitrate/TMAO reductase-like tetraheme cytochrome c subunit
MGPAGSDGKDGKDANETCIQCHNSNIVESVALEYKYSMHYKGEAYEEGTRNNCAPCHSHQGFLDVIKNNTPATITVNPSDPTKYVNNYLAGSSALALPGPISCFTCHSSLHKNYTSTEFMPLSTTAAVPMTMWGGSKTINFSKTTSNLCAKCHQPRPITAQSGELINYSGLVSDPSSVYNLSSISYRTGVHYGTQAAITAGVGGIEFGTGYTNSDHRTLASCTDCHMATPSGLSGGHSFSSADNYSGCNVSGCHQSMNSTNPVLVAVREEITSKINQLAEKINSVGNGHDILQKDPESGQSNGYFDIYDNNSNPTGYWKNPDNGNPVFPTLTNSQFGAILNYQLIFRDASVGVHNYPYIKKLLEESISAI